MSIDNGATEDDAMAKFQRTHEGWNAYLALERDMFNARREGEDYEGHETRAKEKPKGLWSWNAETKPARKPREDDLPVEHLQRQAKKVAGSTKGSRVVKSTRIPEPRTRQSHAKVAKAARANRKAFVNRIPKKYSLTRGVVRTGLGTGWYLWRGARHTSVGAAKMTVKLSSVTSRAAKATAEKRKWAPKAFAGQKMFSTQMACICGATATNMEALNRHFLEAHANDPAPVRGQKPVASLVSATSRRRSGQKLVLLPPGHASRPVAKHRAQRKNTSPANRANALVAAYQSKITEIGVAAVNDNGYVRTISQGWRAFGEQRQNDMKLSELRALAAGMQRAMLESAEAVEKWERHLTRDEHGPGLDPDVTRAPLQRLREHLTSAGGDFSMFVAVIEDAYAPFIKAPVAAPRMDLTK